MTKDEQAELRAALAEYNKPAATQPAQAPLPVGVDRSAMKTEQVEKASALYIREIMRKPGHTVSATEREDLRAEISRVLGDGW